MSDKIDDLRPCLKFSVMVFFSQHLPAELTIVIKFVGVGGNDACLVVSKVVTDLLVAVLVLAEAPIWPRRWIGFSVFLIVTEEAGCLIPVTLTIGLQVRCKVGR